MPGSRNVVSLSIASVLVLMFAVIGWCGGPVASRAPGGQQLGMPPGAMGAGDGGVIPGNLSLAGSLGNGTASGSNGVSPWVSFSSLNMKSNIVYGARGRYEPKLFGLDLGINGDILYTKLSGSTSNWSEFPGHPILTVGQGASADLNLTIISVTGDVGVGSALTGDNTGIRIGPRLGWTQFSDSFKLENTFTGRSRIKGHSAAMICGGLVGQIDLAQFAGLGYSSMVGSTKPVLGGSIMIGGASSMRYYSWEVFLKIFQTASATYAMFDAPFALPTLGFEVAWIRYTFDQTVGDDVTLLAGFTRDQAARYRIDIPTIRAVAAF